VSSSDSLSRGGLGFRIEPLRAIVALLYMAGTLSLSALPGRVVSRWGFSANQLDLLHIPLFAGLAMVTLWAIVAPRVPRALCVLLAITLFAGGDEILQLWVPGRVASYADFARDILGAVIGVMLSEGIRPVAVALREWVLR
jgi:VanZ like protein